MLAAAQRLKGAVWRLNASVRAGRNGCVALGRGSCELQGVAGSKWDDFDDESDDDAAFKKPRLV